MDTTLPDDNRRDRDIRLIDLLLVRHEQLVEARC